MTIALSNIFPLATGEQWNYSKTYTYAGEEIDLNTP
jgi:hypothetical protein